MADTNYQTVPEAAAELDVTEGAVRAAMTEGRLPFAFLYGRKLVSRADLDAYKQRTRPDGEKPKGRPRKPQGGNSDTP